MCFDHRSKVIYGSSVHRGPHFVPRVTNAPQNAGNCLLYNFLVHMSVEHARENANRRRKKEKQLDTTNVNACV